MTRLLKVYEEVKIISVEKISDMSDEDWKWRNGLVGRIGTLYLYKRAQLYRAVLDTETHYFYTGRGLLETENDIIVLRTRNTKYKYMILNEESKEF